MNLLFDEIITITFTLFAVIDILGGLPVIISLKQKNIAIEPTKATVVAGFLMIVFLFAGEKILSFIGLDLSSFAIAGSIVIFIIAIEMILGINLFKEDPEVNSGSIVPIAFPILAGSGTLTTLMSMKSVYKDYNIVIAIVLNLIFIWIVLYYTHWFEKKLGKNGLTVIRKFFGVLLLAIAVKVFKTNF
jgi:multiple antibiotic resistance protein